MRVIVPALLDVPEPRLVPHDDHAKHKAVSVVDTSPAIFAKLD